MSLANFLHQGADKLNNVGTVVLTDFSKAFDMIDHYLFIEKFIHIGVQRSIVPWLCDFLSNRMQCVRYNATLSDFATLSAGLPQGTKLGPIGFQVIIKGTSHDSMFQFSLFSALADIFAVERILLCTKLIHQSSPAEMTYLVQESQIFTVWINFSPGIN